LQLRVLKYHISDSFGAWVRSIHESAADLGIDPDQLQAAVDFLVSAGHLSSHPTSVSHCEKFLSGLTPLRRDVLDYYIYCDTSDEGLATNAVAAGLGISPPKVRLAVDSLTFEDFLFSTIDDHHHKSAVDTAYDIEASTFDPEEDLVTYA